MSGSTGWIIRGNGTAEFANTSIRGTVTAGQVTTTGLTIYSNGAITTPSGKFGVTAGGILSATEVNLSGAITATSGTFTGTVYASSGSFTGTVNASGGTMSGYLRAGDVYIGKNVYDASEHNGIGVDGSWNNAWVRRDTNDTTYFRVGSNDRYIQLDTGGSSGIYFPYFSIDNDGNLNSTNGTITAADVQIGANVGPGDGHYGLSLSSSDFNNIFLRRSDGVYFFRIGYGTSNYIAWDSAGGVLTMAGDLVIGGNTDPGFLRVYQYTDILVNRIKFYNRNYAGWSNSFYPYFDAQYDLGVRNADYRWDNLYYTGSLLDSSDMRIKNNIKDSDLGLDFINKLRPVSYYKI